MQGPVDLLSGVTLSLHLVGICGEHGGEPNSVDFFHRIGLDYVSCSPYRVLTARLAAAQANAREQMKDEMERTK